MQSMIVSYLRGSRKWNASLKLKPFTNLMMTQLVNENTWQSGLYKEQSGLWPPQGNHILAQFDDKTVVVYQAFCKEIADYAVKHQCFGGKDFSYSRMSWIKTNFLWMMYRSGWASKKGQERVLAVRITKKGFDEILRHAWTGQYQKENGLSADQLQVRLQWDPDYSPSHEKKVRRAIQLGLKGEVLKKYGTEWIVNITDLTDFVVQQKKILDEKGEDFVLVAKERVYPVTDKNITEQIRLDSLDS